MAERFMMGCGLVQCFKCCAYGHIAKNCRTTARCGHCSESHETRDCKEKAKKSCANCKAQGHKDNGHKAWDELCQVRVDARHWLCTKLDSRPYLYSVAVIPDRRPLATPTPGPRKPGRPRTEATVETSMGDTEGERERKRMRQSALSFQTIEVARTSQAPSTLPL